ncbi:MAG: UDP-N-acetylmuramoyl-L-alanine--D-glutamate ligase [Gallionella sp.]
MTNFNNQSVLVLGLGETGLSMTRWLSAQGARVRAADSHSAPARLQEVLKIVPAEQVYCGAFNDELLQDINLVAISPGIPMSCAIVASAHSRGISVVGDIELFAQQRDTSNLQHESKVIAITGSNGKTTVTRMVKHLCLAGGCDAVTAGNISPSVLDVVLQRGEKQPAVWVLELSSFQLETTFSLNADVSTVLNVSEDHLDRYTGMEDYAQTKQHIFQGSGLQILNRDDARSMAMQNNHQAHISFGLNPAAREIDFGIERSTDEIWLMQGKLRLLKASELQLSGLHNVANALAALALCRAIQLPMPTLLKALREFKGLAHRMEQIAELNGVRFFDDSKATNVSATVAALSGIGCKSVLIAGGIGKEQDFSPLLPAVSQHARALVLIGRDAPLIEAALNGCNIPILHATDMNAAVLSAAKLAVQGDAVLLSPACASFDMYRNYVHRAEIFVAQVQQLAREDTWPH